jgi:hypothetical protein
MWSLLICTATILVRRIPQCKYSATVSTHLTHEQTSVVLEDEDNLGCWITANQGSCTRRRRNVRVIPRRPVPQPASSTLRDLSIRGTF